MSALGECAPLAEKAEWYRKVMDMGGVWGMASGLSLFQYWLYNVILKPDSNDDDDITPKKYNAPGFIFGRWNWPTGGVIFGFFSLRAPSEGPHEFPFFSHKNTGRGVILGGTYFEGNWPGGLAFGARFWWYPSPGGGGLQPQSQSVTLKKPVTHPPPGEGYRSV